MCRQSLHIFTLPQPQSPSSHYQPFAVTLSDTVWLVLPFLPHLLMSRKTFEFYTDWPPPPLGFQATHLSLQTDAFPTLSNSLANVLKKVFPWKTAGTRNSPSPYFGSENRKARETGPRFPIPFGGDYGWQGLTLYPFTLSHRDTKQVNPAPQATGNRAVRVTTPVWLRFWISGKGANFASICTGLLALQAKN